MLTLILLVVLGGGVGLLAVSLAESPKPATDTGPLRRARRAVSPGPTPAPTPPPATRVEPRHEPVPGPARRAHRGDVPRAYTAVEGRFQDVARAPLWRRLVSLVIIVVIAVVVGAAIAGILGALIAAVAEVVGNTIG